MSEWKEVEITTGDTIDIKKDGIDKVYEGIYTGNKEIQTQIGANTIYSFMGNDGVFSIYGFTMLNLKMQQIATGAKCRIQYDGTKNCKTKFGMKDVHQVKVFTKKIDNTTNNQNPSTDEEIPF